MSCQASGALALEVTVRVLAGPPSPDFVPFRDVGVGGDVEAAMNGRVGASGI